MSNDQSGFAEPIKEGLPDEELERLLDEEEKIARQRSYPARKREKELTEIVIVRMTPELRELLKKDSEENERTESQSVRYYLKLCLIDAVSEEEVSE